MLWSGTDFTGDCRALTERKDLTPYEHVSTYGLMRRLWHDNIRHYLGWLLVALAFMGLTAAATGFSAWLLKPVVNGILVERKEHLLLPLGALIIGTFFIKGFATYIQAAIMARMGLRIIADNQNRLYAHLVRMHMGFFHNVPTGKLISRFTVDIAQMRAAVSNAVTSFGKDIFTLVGLVIVMFIQNAELALITLFVFPIAIHPIARLGKRMRKVTANTQEETGLFMTLLEQTFQGIRMVKSYGMEDYEKGRVGGLIERIFLLSFKSARIRALSSPIMETLGGIAIAVVILRAGHQIVAGETTAGHFVSFLGALIMAYEPMKRLANLNASVQEGLAGAQRLFALLDQEPTLKDQPDAQPIEVRDGRLRLDDVHFSYEPGKPALLGVDLEVPAGRMAALVGPSGAGKSTILNLIPRFYDITSGSVLIDDTDVREATMASLHQSIALVSQEVTLFDDTVSANIVYGKPGASEDEIVEAARHAAAHEFIMELPQGYETVVGERGVKLSGGQRQRLAIARAILKNAPILLLDEATSALDTESERKVQAALDKLMKDRTSLVIAHRLSTVMHADIIYVIDQGKVAEQGTHDELLAKAGLYAKLHALQFAEEAAEA